MNLEFNPIGVLQSPFTEKFGVPRQSLMISEARAILKLRPDPDFRTALNHLESFTHVWIVFIFHQSMDKKWKPTIRPPRVEAPRRVGVFASRSPHRPNPIGISAVKLDKIDLDAPGGIEIHLSGVDLMDGTPVVDIKPYLPFTDRIEEANAGWAESEIPRFEVEFAAECVAQLETLAEYPRLRELLTQMLEWDPRPTSQRRAKPIEDPKSEGLQYGFRVLNFDVNWEIRRGQVRVTHLEPVLF